MANIETDKVTIPVNAPEDGKLLEHFAHEGDTVEVGSNLFSIDTDATGPPSTNSAKLESKEEPPKKEMKEEKKEPKMEGVVVEKTLKTQKADMKFEDRKIRDQEPKSQAPQIATNIQVSNTVRSERREPMSRMRQRIAERMKEAQNSAASLTTFNEVDMSALMNIRSTLKDEFLERHGVKLGYMSAFVKAAAIALKESPNVNAQVDDETKSIVMHDYVDISVAVATPKVHARTKLNYLGIGDSGD